MLAEVQSIDDAKKLLKKTAIHLFWNYLSVVTLPGPLSDIRRKFDVIFENREKNKGFICKCFKIKECFPIEERTRTYI